MAEEGGLRAKGRLGSRSVAASRTLTLGQPGPPMARGALGGRRANLGLRWGVGRGLHLHPSRDGNCGHPAKVGAGGGGGDRRVPRSSPSPPQSERRRRRRGRSVTRPQETRRSNT